MLKNQERLCLEQRYRPEELLSLNRILNVVYMVKDNLKWLWYRAQQGEAALLLADWIQAAEKSEIKSLVDFAKTLNHFAYGLLNHGGHPIDNARLERLNTKIKVIKRRR